MQAKNALTKEDVYIEEFKLTQTVEGKVGFCIFKPIIYLKSDEKFQFEKAAGVTLIELLIGILVTSLMMGGLCLL